ncbi:hypothetical protein BDV28DRAFT_129448 [Aspergillus coremiiformis]|uniref:Uncharacterized protein n=1 Tax=Aspergillus coremiiformis TaxID=138285 RepID=A0A5N6ZC43_9EURO|nr:hypothetical protein BDV28DRAFT_129448 [Aspergillus coremiiformis]
MGSVVLPHLRTAWHVDQAILSEEERLVVRPWASRLFPDARILIQLNTGHSIWSRP